MSKTTLPQKVAKKSWSKQPYRLLKQNCKVMVKMPLFTWLYSQNQTERTPSIGYIPTLKIATHTLRQSKSGKTVWTMAPWNLERPLAIFIITYLIRQHFLLTWEMQSGDEINLLAISQLQTTTGTTPSNSGQVIQECAKSQRIDISNFNKDRNVSVRDGPRIRVPKKKIASQLDKKNIQVAIPSERPISQINDDISALVESGDIDIGKPVTPKEVQYQQIFNGEVTTKTALIYGRQIPLQSIRTTELARQVVMGVIKDPGVTIKWHPRLWYGHSDIGKSAHMLVTIQTLLWWQYLPDWCWVQRKNMFLTCLFYGNTNNIYPWPIKLKWCRHGFVQWLPTERSAWHAPHGQVWKLTSAWYPQVHCGWPPCPNYGKRTSTRGGYSCPCSAQSSRQGSHIYISGSIKRVQFARLCRTPLGR